MPPDAQRLYHGAITQTRFSDPLLARVLPFVVGFHKAIKQSARQVNLACINRPRTTACDGMELGKHFFVKVPTLAALQI